MQSEFCGGSGDHVVPSAWPSRPCGSEPWRSQYPRARPRSPRTAAPTRRWAASSPTRWPAARTPAARRAPRTRRATSPPIQFIGVERVHRRDPVHEHEAEWQRYMEILAARRQARRAARRATERRQGDVATATTTSRSSSSPKPEYRLGRPADDRPRRARSPTWSSIRVTDESVPDAGKKRYALSLSIHGIERAGAEGGIRAMEDLVTAGTIGKRRPADRARAGRGPTRRRSAMSSRRRSSTSRCRTRTAGGAARSSTGGVFFQRYNGNGVDPNRDWPDIGFAFRGYSAISEPETAACTTSTARSRTTGVQFAAGDDLHGQPFADALSYTLLPHGRHHYDKNVRIREAAMAIHHGTYEAIKWSPIVVPNDSPRGGSTATCEDTRRSAPPAGRSTRRPGARSTTRSTTRRRVRSGTGSTRPSASTRTGSTTRCRSRTSTRTSTSTRTPSSCTWTATRR